MFKIMSILATCEVGMMVFALVYTLAVGADLKLNTIQLIY